MASDGRIWFNTKLDNSQIEKDLKNLERKIKRSQEEIATTEGKKLPLVKQAEDLGAKLDAAKAKAAQLKAEMESITLAETSADPMAAIEASARKTDAAAELKASEKEVQTLQNQWDSVNNKIDDYDRKIKQATTDISRATQKTAELNAQLAKPSQIKMAQAMEKVDKSASRFGRRLWEIGKPALVFNLISAGLRGMVSYMGTALKSNSQYTAQLAQLKGAWLTAFQPIYDFVLPGLLAIMRVLTTIGNALAAVLSFFSGKTATQSAKNAQALNKQAGAIGGVGKAAEKAKKQLMGFDEINRLEDTSTDTGGGGGGGGGAGTIAPDFSGITDMEEELTQILGLVAAIAAGLLTWKIASMFTDSLAIAAGLGIAVGGAMLLAFNWADAFANGIDWDNLSGMLLGIAALAGGLAIAFGATGAAIGLLIGGIALVVLALHEWITTGELSNEACIALVAGIMAIGGAIALFMGPSGWIALLVAAVVAFVVAAATKGDEIKAIFANVVQWFKDTFLRDWTQVFGDDLGSILNGFFQVCADILDGLEQMFGGLVDFIQNAFAGNWSEAWASLVNAARGAVNGIIAAVNGMIRVVTAGINELFRLLSLNIELPGGGSIGWNLPQFTAPQIPYLAQGAVLPANKPFLAMVGDQRNGTNIEAPLETIKQALAEVMAQYGGGDVNITFTGELAALARVLAPVISKAQRDNDRGRGR